MDGKTASERDERGLGRARAKLLVLALSAFAAVTTEMAPVGLLPEISTEFGVAESTTGLIVSLYAALVALIAVPITLATRGISGRRLLLIAAVCYALANAICAAAPSFAVLAAGRGIGGITHALFFSVCIGYAARLVPPAHMGRALALASSGAAAGFVLGVPLSTAVGNLAGWRASFWMLAALMILTAVLIVAILPDARAYGREGRGRLRHRGSMLAAISANMLTYLGHYTLYTYVTVLLLGAGASSLAVAPILLLFGLFGLIALWLAAPQLDRRPRRAALMILCGLVLGSGAIGAAYPALPLVLAAAVVWNTAFGPVASLFQSATVRTGSASPELSGAWVNATANTGIAAGAALGGLVLSSFGMREVALAACALLVAAAIIVFLARGAFPHRPASRRVLGAPHEKGEHCARTTNRRAHG